MKKIILFLSIALIGSCAELNMEENVRLLKDELKSLEECSQKLESIFNQDYDYYLTQANSELKRYQDRNDTISIEKANEIIQLQSLKMNFENFQESKSALEKQISLSSQNIEDLLFDIENEVGKRKDYEKNSSIESKKVDELSLLLDRMVFVKDSCIQNVNND